MTKFNVTKNHMKRGKIDSQRSCPIALCIRGHFHQHFGGSVLVGNRVIHSTIPLTDWAKERDIEDYSISTGISKWINRFDEEYPVDEITICAKEDYLYIEGEIE